MKAIGVMRPSEERPLIEEYPELISSRYVQLLQLTVWVILVGAAIVAAWMAIALEKSDQWRTYFPMALVTLAIATYLVLRYRGPVTAVRLLTLGGWGLATAAGFFTEGVRTPILLVYPLILIFSGWILGVRFGIRLFIASSIAIIAMATGQAMGVIGGKAPFPQAIMALAHIIVLTISIVLTVYLLRSFRESYARYRLLTESIKDVVWILDVETMHYRYISPSVERLRGYTPEEMLAVPMSQVLAPASGRHAIDLIRDRAQDLLAGKESPTRFYTDEVEQSCKDGSTVWTEVITSYYCNPESGRMEVRGVTRDISERKRMEDQVRQMALHDTLTNLPNRRLLNDRLGQMLAASKRSGRYGAMLFLDLDNFKSLNDTHGHDVGDLLLIEAAKRLESCVREVDTVARFGGDEFVVMVSELSADKSGSTTQGGIIAEKIRAALAKPYVLQVRHDGAAETTVEHQCTASIGVVLFGKDDASEKDILKWADTAMYQAKAAGFNLIRFYAPSV